MTEIQDQRAFARASTRIGTPVPINVAGRRLPHRQPFFGVEPTAPNDPRRLALPGEQDEDPPIAEGPPLLG